MEASLPPAMAVDLMDTSLERDQQILMLSWALVLVLLLIHLGEALLADLSKAFHHSAMGLDVPSMARGQQMLRLTLNLPLMVRDLLSPMVLLVMFMVWELLGTLDMLPAMLEEPSMAILLPMGMDIPSMARDLQRLTLNLPLMVRDLLSPMELLVMFTVWELLGTLDMLPAMLEEQSMAILLFIGLDLSMAKGQLNQQLIPTMVAMDIPMVCLAGIHMCPDLLLTVTDVNIPPTPERAVM